MLTGYETLMKQLSKCDKFKFIVPSFYHTPFKSYDLDYNPTTDIKDRFWTRGQFANQVIRQTYLQSFMILSYAVPETLDLKT